jgi:outer membrane protein OmpA-like peptidoglycan-associated protein
MRKKNIKFLTDFIIVFLCLTGAVFSGAAFWREYNYTLVKLNEKPVGTIVFKKRSAQRKFIERNVWDRLKQTSPVYNGDTIRTIEQSEAVIIFQDKLTYLTMDESTMIQVYLNNQSGARVDLSTGNLEVVSEHKNIMISSGTSTIAVEGQTRINKNADEFILFVLEGQANYDGMKIEAGNILALDSDGEISTKPIIAMTSFGSSVYVLGSPDNSPSDGVLLDGVPLNGARVPVVFVWNDFNFKADTHVIVEIAVDRNFSDIIESRDIKGTSSVSIFLQNGSYRWRAFPANSGSNEPLSRLYPSGTLEIIPSAAPVLISPANTGEFTFKGESLIPLSWSGVKMASAYLLEISPHANMHSPIVSRRVEQNSIIQTGLNKGRWHWRVTPVFPHQFKGIGNSSATGEFSVSRDPVQSPPASGKPVPLQAIPPVIFSANTKNWNNLSPETIEVNEKILIQIVHILNTHDEYRLRIEGHANPETNPDDTAGRHIEQIQELLPLSEIRAKTVADRLVNFGIDSRRLEYRGLGGENPAAAWEDSSNCWKNRRVEFVLMDSRVGD